MKTVRTYINEHPLKSVIFVALFIRIIAAIFARGYGMHDDHFCVIEPAQSWVDGTDYNNWLPGNQVNPVPQGHSFFYVGVHFIILTIMKLIGLENPQLKMFIIRLLHALLSMGTVILSYKITEKLSGKANALKVGMVVALMWFFPWLSVRNLVEVVSIPFLFWGIWMIYKAEESDKKFLYYFLAGLITGIAFSLRFQTSIFIAGMGLALLFLKRWKETFVFGFGAVICILILQGIPDFLIWKRPFTELTEYINYNILHRNEYGNNKLTLYFEVILGFFIPPMSLLWFFGFFRTWKKHLLIFLPTVIFLVFHTYFPNKQERFIFTIMPFILMLGIIGWEEFVNTRLQKFKTWNHGLMVFFWSINLSLIFFMSSMYSKKARVETMSYLYHNKDSISCVVVDDVNSHNAVMLPIFYLGKWVPEYRLERNTNPEDSLRKGLKHDEPYFKVAYNYEYFKTLPVEQQPRFFVFAGKNNLGVRVNNVKKYFPGIAYQTTIVPGYIDRFVSWVNPKNSSEEYQIYKIKD